MATDGKASRQPYLTLFYFPSCICSFRTLAREHIDEGRRMCHFGCLTLVGESTRMPLRYHQNNVAGTLNLLEVLEKHGVREIVFVLCGVWRRPNHEAQMDAGVD